MDRSFHAVIPSFRLTTDAASCNPSRSREKKYFTTVVGLRRLVTDGCLFISSLSFTHQPARVPNNLRALEVEWDVIQPDGARLLVQTSSDHLQEPPPLARQTTPWFSAIWPLALASPLWVDAAALHFRADSGREPKRWRP